MYASTSESRGQRHYLFLCLSVHPSVHPNLMSAISKERLEAFLLNKVLYKYPLGLEDTT